MARYSNTERWMTWTKEILKHEHAASVEYLIKLTPIRTPGLKTSLTEKLSYLSRELRLLVVFLKLPNSAHYVLAAYSRSDEPLLA